MAAQIDRRDAESIVMAARMAHRIDPRPTVMDFVREEFRQEPLRPRDVAVFLIGLAVVALFVVLFCATGRYPA